VIKEWGHLLGRVEGVIGGDLESAIIDGIVIAVHFLARLVYLHVGGNGDAVFVDLVDFHRDSPL
jgi:hypothetical protein